MTEILALHAFDDNYIWLLRAGGCVAVVDPGDAAPVLAHLEQSGDRLCAILATHHHGDHIGGLEELTSRFPVPVFGPALENISGVSHALSGGERIELPEIGLGLEVIAVPGHTRGHLAYYGPSIDDVGAVFCGDTLFGAGCGRLFEGTPAQMHESLSKLAALPEQTFVYCAHEYTQSNMRFALAVEPGSVAVQRRSESVAAERAKGRATIPTTIRVELETNPFLRWDAPAVRSAAASRLGHAPADAVETFAAIREWKNRF
jgi:hydroxyacylglutathione hydrolase